MNRDLFDPHRNDYPLVATVTGGRELLAEFDRIRAQLDALERQLQEAQEQAL